MLKVTNFIFISILSIGLCSAQECPEPGPACSVTVSLQSRIIATMPCPFTSTGKLNLPMVDELCEWVHKSCITGILIGGYFGGAMQCSREELQQLAKQWEKCTNKYGIDLMMEVGAFGSLNEVYKLAKYVSKLNVTALFAFPEPVLQPEDPSESNEDYERLCAAAGGVPVLSHQPLGYDQKVGPVQTYISARNVVSCYCGAVGSIDRLMIIRSSTPDAADCAYITDTGDQVAAGLLLGAAAAAGLPNALCPGLALAIEAAANAYNVEEALKLQKQMDTVIAAVCNSNGGRLDDTSRTYIEEFKLGFYLKSGLNTGTRYPMEKPNSTVYDQIVANWECVKDLCY